MVLGMHRSGTSLVAGLLKILGVDIGQELLGAHWSNPTGHFEDLRFLQLNKEILEKAGGSYLEPPSRESILALQGNVGFKIDSLIRQRTPKTWGWKDPATCLTIDLYLPYLNNPLFVVCFRNPLQIALSLQKREAIGITKGLRLTSIYNQRISNFFADHNNLKKLYLSYEEIINNPESELNKLIAFLQISPDFQAYQKAVRFILPRTEINHLKKRFYLYYIKEALIHPWKVPAFIFRKISGKT